jgi:hypothetical protein
MAKSTKKSPLPAGEDLRELIVVISQNAGIVSNVDSVASATSANVSSLNALLKKHQCTMTPVFGPEDRVRNTMGSLTGPSLPSDVGYDSFYSITTSGDKEAIAKELSKDANVLSAYIKPPAEAPVYLTDSAQNSNPSNFAPPATPNFIPNQTYLNAAPGGIDAIYAHSLPGGKGNNVRIIDIEGAWQFTHEDLIANQGGVIGGTQSTSLGWRNHGTAVVGVFGGDDNGKGILGISPNAITRAISIFDIGSATAIRNAADALTAGDIILIELHRAGPRHNFAARGDQAGYIAIEWWPDDFAAIRYAVSRGVIVVEAAGNGQENLDDAIYSNRPADFPASWTNPFNMSNRQSGATIVGAGAPPPGTHGRDHGPDRSRLNFSNYGSRVDVQGWGREVTTCGYGDLQGGDENFWYTDIFSGTSSASPIVVGALACIQGRLINKGRPKLTPASATNLLRTTGSPQQNAPGRPATQRIGNRPNLRQAFTSLNIHKGLLGDKGKDIKEFKEHKEFKEFKEKREIEKNTIFDKRPKEFKEFKEIREFDDFDIRDRIRPTDAGPSTVEDRIENLEQAISMLQHFISSDQRPDLEGYLYNDIQ